MNPTTERLTAALADRYRIERELGAGGMATVYLAEDVKHRRLVALKVLKPELAAVLGADRFIQEITTTAALQHPHILPLFDSGSADGFLYYVMPFIDGETLRSKLDRETQLGIDEAVKITTAIADALDYAHRRGVIHRDIKPENILLHEGRPMVADFGIAIAVSAAAGGRMTETGLSLGTPHYMSPEQATAEKEISARSDIYSLASVLYEMLTGNPPHTGASAQQIIMKIVTEEAAPVTKLRKSVPNNVAAAVAKALEKLPADRFASAAEFSAALTDSAYDFHIGVVQRTANARPARTKAMRWAVPAIIVLTLGGGYAVGRRGAEQRGGSAPITFAIDLPDSVRSITTCCGRAMAISPDGRTLVFVGNAPSGSRMLYRRDLGNMEAETMPGTSGASIPFFSPDGEWVGFKANDQLKKVRLNGGPVTPITAVSHASSGATWGDDGTIIYSEFSDAFQVSHLRRVQAAGGPSTTLLIDSTRTYSAPFMLPGSKLVLVSVTDLHAAGAETIIGLLKLSSGRMDTLASGLRAEYARGFLVYGASDASLLVQPLDAVRGRTNGPAEVVLSAIAVRGSVNPEFAVSESGWLTYMPKTSGANEVFRIIGSGVDSVLALPGQVLNNLEDPAVSPDGRRVAMRLLAENLLSASSDIWLLDRTQGTLARFTVGGGGAPVWSRDGQRIAFQAPGSVGAKAGMYVRDVGRSGAATTILEGRDFYPASWLPDDRTLVFSALFSDSLRKYEIGAITLGDSVPRWIASSSFNEKHPQISPDGRRIAYTSDRTGRDEVYIGSMTDADVPMQVSSEGGNSPRWRSDGRVLFYVSGTSIMADSLAAVPRLEVASRRVIAEGRAIDVNASDVNWAVFPDGKHFLFIDQAVAASELLVLLSNWTQVAHSTAGKK